MFVDPSNPFESQIMAGLKQFAGTIETWAIPIAAIGTFAMAFIQAIKNITPLRNWFQKIRLRNWLRMSIRGDYSLSQRERIARWFNVDFRRRFKEESSPTQAALQRVEQRLVDLATSGDRDAFYDLPIEDLCGQIRKVLSVVLDYPERNKELLYCLARGASSDDIDVILGKHGSTAGSEEPISTEPQKNPSREFAAAKGRILVQIRCSIDAIQTSIGFRWKFWLQFASMILSAIIGVVALNIGSLPPTTGPLNISSKFWASVLIGFLAGFLAPVARDLMASIEKWRS